MKVNIEKAYRVAIKNKNMNLLQLIYSLTKFNIVSINVTDDEISEFREWWNLRYRVDRDIDATVERQARAVCNKAAPSFLDKFRSDKKKLPDYESIATNNEILLLKARRKRFKKDDGAKISESIELMFEYDYADEIDKIINFCADNLSLPIKLTAKSILHLFAKYNQVDKIVRLLNDHSAIYKSETILGELDIDHNNFLHYLTIGVAEDKPENLVDLLRLLLLQNDFQTLFTQTNIYGRAPIDCAQGEINRLRLAIEYSMDDNLKSMFNQIIAKRNAQLNATRSKSSHAESDTKVAREVRNSPVSASSSTSTSISDKSSVYRFIAEQVIITIQHGFSDIDDVLDWSPGLTDETLKDNMYLTETIEFLLKKHPFITESMYRTGNILQLRSVLYIVKKLSQHMQDNMIFSKQALNQRKLVDLETKITAIIHRTEILFPDIEIIPASLIRIDSNETYELAQRLVNQAMKNIYQGYLLEIPQLQKTLRLDGIAQSSEELAKVNTGNMSANLIQLKAILVNALGNINLKRLNLTGATNSQSEFCYLLASFLRGRHVTSSIKIIEDNGSVTREKNSKEIINRDFRRFIDYVSGQFKAIFFSCDATEVSASFNKYFLYPEAKGGFVKELAENLNKYFFISHDEILFQHVSQLMSHLAGLKERANSLPSATERSILMYWFQAWHQRILSQQPNVIKLFCEGQNGNILLKKALKKDIRNGIDLLYSAISFPGGVTSNAENLYLTPLSTFAFLYSLRTLYQCSSKLHIAPIFSLIDIDMRKLCSYLNSRDRNGYGLGVQAVVYTVISKTKRCHFLIKNITNNYLHIITTHSDDDDIKLLINELNFSDKRLHIIPEGQTQSSTDPLIPLGIVGRLDSVLRDILQVTMEYPRTSTFSVGAWVICQLLTIITEKNEDLIQKYHPQYLELKQPQQIPPQAATNSNAATNSQTNFRSSTSNNNNDDPSLNTLSRDSRVSQRNNSGLARTHYIPMPAPNVSSSIPLPPWPENPPQIAANNNDVIRRHSSPAAAAPYGHLPNTEEIQRMREAAQAAPAPVRNEEQQNQRQQARMSTRFTNSAIPSLQSELVTAQGLFNERQSARSRQSSSSSNSSPSPESPQSN